MSIATCLAHMVDKLQAELKTTDIGQQFIVRFEIPLGDIFPSNASRADIVEAVRKTRVHLEKSGFTRSTMFVSDEPYAYIWQADGGSIVLETDRPDKLLKDLSSLRPPNTRIDRAHDAPSHISRFM